MPSLDDMIDKKVARPLRELLYGRTQTKKTWWVGKAAEAGYNVLLLEGDGNPQVLSNIAPEARHRVHVLNMGDKLGKFDFIKNVTWFFRGQDMLWDDTNHQVSLTGMKPGNDYYKLNANKLNTNWVVGLDSYTALVQSAVMKYAEENGIDLSEAEKGEDGRAMFLWLGNYLNWMLSQAKALPCHFVMVCHEDVWEKRKKDPVNSRKEIVEFTRTQIKSSSGPHAMQVPKHFTDVLRFTLDGTKNIEIDGQPDKDRDGGSRTMAVKKPWKDFQFIDLVKSNNSFLPNPELGDGDGVVKITATEVPATGTANEMELPKPLQNAVVDATAAAAKVAVVQGKPSLSALLKKPAAQ